MYNLNHISVQELFSLEERTFSEYMELQKALKARPLFSGKQARVLGELSYGDVSTLKYNLMNPNFENVFDNLKMVFEVDRYDAKRADVVSFFYALNWINKEVKILMEREAKTLQRESDEDTALMEIAGVNRLSSFGELPVLKMLGQQYGKSPQEIEKWSYNLVFTLLLEDKVSGEIQKSFNELKHGRKRQT